MKLGQRLLELRKLKGLSQEEVAEKLDVTRQTISKWETDQSTPDFDKIVPLCELYGITSDELLRGKKSDASDSSTPKEEVENTRKNKAKGIGIGILTYFVAIAWVMVSIPVLRLNPILSSAIFLLICGIGTYIIVYTSIIYKKEKTKVEKRDDKLRNQIENIVALITVVIYLIVSFTTRAWHITWIIWVVFGLFSEILKLLFMLRRNDDEK